MKPLRKKRLESNIVREIAELIMRRRIKDERLGFVSVTGVNLAPDLSQMEVRVSLFSTDENENRITWQALKDNARWLQSEVSHNLRLRVTPRLYFELDTSIAEGDRILKLMDQDHPVDS
ncbi:MAG: 30S ribosome-binding factor RbfA [Leptospiraceae bacterium]|nr:30S ribosome-binding factor RbfA [Leptospiraceae bacterium]MCB1314600.1 30S ribosome-binding factor RbfA [Leptospiraceae bacterium]MCB1318637.1 30S ribosome-binding factor RbfA [Leptospiraceae bacterium]